MVTKGYLIFAFSLMIGFFAGCETMHEVLNLKKPTAQLVGLKFEEVKLDYTTLVFDVEIDNHYPVNLPLTNFDYSLSTGAEKFLTGDANSQTTVPKKSKKTVSLPAKINYIEMLKAQEALSEETITVTAGGGAVTVVMTGQQRVESISIAPEVVDPDDVDMLEDLVTAAVNEALERSQELAAERMGALTGGLSIPGLM